MADKKNTLLLISIIIVLFSAVAFTYFYLNAKIRNAIRQQPIIITENERRIYSPPIPDSLFFCGEKVPLEDFDVRERIEREFLVNTYWHSATLLYLKRANRWFPLIEKILDEYNIHDDFKYLAVAESGLINVVSPAGATGFWQLMESTAKKYGLEINNEIDERYDVEKSTIAACKYLLEAKSKLGNWTLAGASYNFGISGIENQIQSQQTKNYYNLYLNEETYRFIARIIALKEIFKNPKNYGFYVTDDELYPQLEFSEVKVDYSIKDLVSFAKSNGINYKLLKIFNPWLRNSSLINKNKKTYILKIAKGNSALVNEE
ncbi:MAG: lytic transglycosylase domain-containing protein [Melioribacteraceae bacterium]|nr:lytic transglycosylase domain-containing protein [Melioribacteraceae bacterium]